MTLIRFRCTKEQKEAFVRVAKNRNETESELGRAMLDWTLKLDKQVPALEETAKEYELRNKAIHFRTTLSEYSSIKAHATAKGMGTSTWALKLARAHITHQPQLSNDEIAALREASRELAAVGRNLNQVAHAINANLNSHDQASYQLLQSLDTEIARLRSSIKDLVDTNLNRWCVFRRT